MMRRTATPMARMFPACTVILVFSTTLYAWAPNDSDLSAAAAAGDFTKYVANTTAWLDQKAPNSAAGMTEARLKVFVTDPAAHKALVQRQFMTRVWGTGKDVLGAFAKADAKNREFVGWVVRNTQAMDMMMVARTPSAMFARDDDSWSMDAGMLSNWRAIYEADPASRQGLYLRLAIATVIRPPGSGNRGAGMQEKPDDVLSRYTQFKKAHAAGELAASFDGLSVWELTHVVSSCASNADLAWGREMIKAFKPELLNDERVANMTSQVQYQGSQIPYKDFSCVVAGGGKCGPRSSFGVFINQAFGIPAVGVGQPAHAAVAYKHFRDGWQVCYGRGWNVSKVTDRYGMSGDEFLKVTAERENGTFDLVEHMRWLSAALSDKPRKEAVLAVARKLHASPAASVRPRARPVAQRTPRPAPRPQASAGPAAGVIRIDAAKFFTQGGQVAFGGQYAGVPVIDSPGGGKQVHFQALMPDSYVGYKIEVPKSGVYELTALVSTVNWGQNLYVRSFGAMYTPKAATASAVYHNMVKDLGGQKVIDNDLSTRWAVNEGTDHASVEIDLGRPLKVSKMLIDERMWNRISKFRVEYKDGGQWKPLFEDGNIGIGYSKAFPAVVAQYFRLTTLDCRQVGGPTIWEVSLGDELDGQAWINTEWTRGLWATTKPVDIRLTKGSQTIWVCAPYQRGVSMKWLELKPKAP